MTYYHSSDFKKLKNYEDENCEKFAFQGHDIMLDYTCFPNKSVVS